MNRRQPWDSSSSPPDWPVLVTGAGGFVGGHVARALAESGYRVRGLTRQAPRVEAGDPAIEWLIGDLRSPDDRARALEGTRGVIHCGGWVSLGADARGEGRATNVEATRALLEEGKAAGVERFVYTSTIWTIAAGSADRPADEDSEWNLQRVRSPYCDTKREAERLVLSHNGPALRTSVLCPGLVIGPRDVKLTSTWVLLANTLAPVAIYPRGGIPVVDARVLAQAHMRALERAEPGRRYVVAGPYLSYLQMTDLVKQVTGRPRWVVTLPDVLERPSALVGGLIDRVARGRFPFVSAAAAAGGYLQLHVSGARADLEFGLCHPRPIDSIYDALADCRRSGHAHWLNLTLPDGYQPIEPAKQPPAVSAS
jgi:dihydroflavonol-4-reductase